ncbi:cupredoxin domain-containing protein [Streptomyces sp. SP17BM10]|uniref:cupredoxin domain-containing protein n=1 Tax=Streptomyces sp. SP17BM10 TaxID=3002530 RepID=UPI002E79937C|nr:cupredoxin domain-containing protein [Streptomyces sp. SP17BM10]MEE1786454.1 cupredoxin domain-containing protein [Streptomyces sp. SP17BM10]
MRPPTRLARAAGVAFLAAVLSGCLSAYIGSAPDENTPTAPQSVQPGPTTAAPTGAAAVTVTIRDFLFQPANLTVRPGGTVTVVNADTVAHTLTAQDRTFDTAPIAPGASATFTAPTQRGAYAYQCTFHHFMRGILTVA